jgi:hypothetical protein
MITIKSERERKREREREKNADYSSKCAVYDDDDNKRKDK